jgi:glyoxalase family protein
MATTIAGMHHVTALAIDPQANLDFYTRVLGLRLVKQTVNFDATRVYHFYFGDRLGRPGTLITFFPFTDAAAGASGAGMTETVSFAVPATALDAWMRHLTEHGVTFDGPFDHFGSPTLKFRDPDGLTLALVATEEAAAPTGGTPGAVLGFDSVTLCIASPDATARLLTETFGYRQVAAHDGALRFHAAGDGIATAIEIRTDVRRGKPGGGTVHHIAFRARTSEEQLAWRERLVALGFDVTEVRDRQYFTSIYFREPGGVLFEIATDAPGFAVDEAPEALGRALKLPPWLEKTRPDIEARLPPIKLPAAAA